MNITIIGTGVYGISMAMALSLNKKNKIIMWSESEESKKQIEASRSAFAPLGGKSIPDCITFTTSYEEA